MSHTQGAVPLKHVTYVQRQFENRLVREVMAGRWVLMLGPRQHGKSSALFRLRNVLTDGQLPVALVDLQAAPPPTTYEDLVNWFCRSIQQQVCPSDHRTLLDGSDLGALLAAALPAGNAPVTVLIDEASSIPDRTWRNSFYGQLRAISSRRAAASSEDAATRLRFAFTGTFSPETLIDEANSPFNVCERIDTEDLTFAEVADLVKAILGVEREDIARVVYEEIGGQPFLVQKLVGAAAGAADPLTQLTAEIAELRTGQSDHVEHLFSRVLGRPDLAEIATKMVADGSVPNEAGNPGYRYLQVLGLARRDGNKLVFRNKLYAHVASISPQLGGQASAGVHAPLFPLTIGAFSNIQNAQLKEIAHTIYNGSVSAYRGGANRLALAGFGSSLEAALLDVMLRRSDRATLLSTASHSLQGSEKVNDPKSWSLFSLIKAASSLGALRSAPPPQALREWRNTIHPAVCLRNYKTDAALEVEARVAASWLELTLRDIP